MPRYKRLKGDKKIQQCGYPLKAELPRNFAKNIKDLQEKNWLSAVLAGM